MFKPNRMKLGCKIIIIDKKNAKENYLKSLLKYDYTKLPNIDFLLEILKPLINLRENDGGVAYRLCAINYR